MTGAIDFVGAATPLSPDDIASEAAALGCEPAVIHAVCDVESAGGGFLPDGRPKILFEAHAFWNATDGRFGQSNVSSPAWDRSLYGPGGVHQYLRLSYAMALDRVAALRSASWGMFQILGSNHAACGFADVETFVAAMLESERRHLDAFAAFCRANHLDDELRSTPPKFAAFARGYNGPGYAANAYDTKLAAAWRKWRARPSALPNPAPRTLPDTHYATLQRGSHGPDVAELQRALGFEGKRVDGDFGPVTEAGVVHFQLAHDLVPDGIVGPRTRLALEQAAGSRESLR